MPFNKGDFTQQGVAGHVNANLRLNEKRLVNIDLTSNEEAAGCTITGTVKDLLNNQVYGVGAGVSGNIEITENGENINVAPYATATVNVAGGGGDVELLYTTINIINNDEVSKTITGSLANYGIVTDEKYFFTTADAQEELNMASLNETVAANSTKTLTFYYAPYSMENIAFAVIIAKGDNDTADNMVWTNNAWVVSDTAANSTLNIVLDK